MADKQYFVNRKDGTITIITSETVLAGTAKEALNGQMQWLEWVTANMQDTDSTKLDIVSSAGGTLYTSGTVAESTRFTVGTQFPVEGTISLVATAEGTQSASRAIIYSLYYRT